jgi:hypothetical protein
MGEMHTKFVSLKSEGKRHSEDLHADAEIILEWILRKEGGKVWTGFIWLRTGASGSTL